MTQQATICGDVTYTPGDGAPIAIPRGPVEIDQSEDSTTLSWTADNNAAGSAAMPHSEFDRYVSEGSIALGATSA
ncbi:MAG: hypothetical protein ACTS8S_20570 [Giesbergeria sp.]